MRDMTTRTATVAIITVVSVFFGMSDSTQAVSLDQSVVGVPSASLNPHVVTFNASAEQLARLSTALNRYSDSGLRLPNLRAEFHENTQPCGGVGGLFRSDSTPWTILICTDDLGVVYEHELAHAWERANIAADLREEFMERGGYREWRSHDVPSHERAVEGIAISIQQGLSGLPLPPRLGTPTIDRLKTYEFLTGRPEPRLLEWMNTRQLDCDERPTPLSTVVPDSRGVVCGGELPLQVGLSNR